VETLLQLFEKSETAEIPEKEEKEEKEKKKKEKRERTEKGKGRKEPKSDEEKPKPSKGKRSKQRSREAEEKERNGKGEKEVRKRKSPRGLKRAGSYEEISDPEDEAAEKPKDSFEEVFGIAFENVKQPKKRQKLDPEKPLAAASKAESKPALKRSKTPDSGSYQSLSRSQSQSQSLSQSQSQPHPQKEQINSNEKIQALSRQESKKKIPQKSGFLTQDFDSEEEEEEKEHTVSVNIPQLVLLLLLLRAFFISFHLRQPSFLLRSRYLNLKIQSLSQGRNLKSPTKPQNPRLKAKNWKRNQLRKKKTYGLIFQVLKVPRFETNLVNNISLKWGACILEAKGKKSTNQADRKSVV